MKRIFKLPLLLIFLANSVFWMNCSKDDPISPINQNDNVSNTNFEAKDSFSYEIDVVGHSGLSLEAINGTIVFTEVTASNSVKISGEKRVESESTEDAEAHLKELSVDVQDLTNEILVKTLQPKHSGGRHYIVNYTISLPKNMDVTVYSLNGRVTLNEIFGNVSVDLINGDIDGKVTLPLDGTIHMGITNGSIDLDIPQNTSAEFTASVTNGSISVSNLELRNRVEISKSLTGTLGDGRGTISLNTTNGNIMVTGF
jgi:DUF4097 and DUF4098 domain-containing protein YvlB